MEAPDQSPKQFRLRESKVSELESGKTRLVDQCHPDTGQQVSSDLDGGDGGLAKRLEGTAWPL